MKNMIKYLLILAVLFQYVACSSQQDDVVNEFEVQFELPSSIDITKGGEFVFMVKDGNSPSSTDLFILESDAGISYVKPIIKTSSESFTILLDDEFKSGYYNVSIKRDTRKKSFGKTYINIVEDIGYVPEEGTTVFGIVSSNGVGIEGVVVSDGYEVTTTNEEGIYSLPSKKKNRYVFISVPGNYEVVNSENLPMFFQRLAGGTTIEQKDFSLIKTDNTKHVVLAMADWHLANRNNDVDQFANGMLPDINATIAEYKAQGKKVYGLTLGDLSWDIYWYSNSFGLPEYLKQMYKINSTVFNVIGNHDNDPYVSNDWDGALAFKENIAPNYYSFNLGEVHYVVLDNVEWINTGGSQGVIGSRNYNGNVVADQMEWLKKDLATIKDKSTPIVVAMHIPLYSYPSLNANGSQNNSVRLDNGSQILSYLNEFSNVKVLTGHTHCNFTVEDSPNVMEYNIAAISATWWWTGKNGYAGNHICKDGSPGGYGVWEIDGKDMQYYYKSMGYKKDYQFRTYDLNKVHITADKFAPKADANDLARYAGVYASPSNSNEVLINIWGYDTKWKIEVKENDENLVIQRVNAKDPLHIISYEAQRLNVGAEPTSSFVTNNTAHLFKVKASSSTSTLDIKVTDRFGNVYTETMERPKLFTHSMK